MRILLISAALLALCSSTAAASDAKVPVFGEVMGEYREVTVEQGDTLGTISARFGVTVATLIKDNQLLNPDMVPAGKSLVINARRIVPALTTNGLVADIAGGLLYRFEGGKPVQRLPAGFGSSKSPTPEGKFKIMAIEKSGLDYPESFEEEQRSEAFTSRHKTLPDEEHPLGPLYILLSGWDFAIHGTRFERSAGAFDGRRHIRLRHEELFKLSPKISEGMEVVSDYMPVRAALTADGGVWLEAHPDPYGRGEAGIEELLAALGDRATDISREKAARVLKERRGSAELVGRLQSSSDIAERNSEECSEARLRCLDCPPGDERRVTLQLTALSPIEIEGEFPIEVLNAAGNLVYSPRYSGAPATMRKGEVRNFVWELADSHGRPLPVGQYTVRALFRGCDGKPISLSLPLWADR